MTVRTALGAMLVLALGARPAAAEEWRGIAFGPPGVFNALDVDSVKERAARGGSVTSAWFRIVRPDLQGVPRLVRMENYEFRCARGESRLAGWGDFYPDGRIAAAGRAPTTAEFKPVELGGRSGHAAALWQAACATL